MSAFKTAERYLGCKQRLRNAVNDNTGLEPAKSRKHLLSALRGWAGWQVS